MEMRASPPPPPSSMLGFRRSIPAKHHKQKRFLRKLVNYLKTDSYMFAPLISSSASSSSSRKYTFGSRKGNRVISAGFEMGVWDEEDESKKRLMKRIGEYLKSDSYLYGPLVEQDKCADVAQKQIVDSDPPGTPCLKKRVTTSLVKTALTRKNNLHPSEDFRNAKGDEELIPDTLDEINNVTDQAPKPNEMVKLVGFPNYWSSLLPVSDLFSNGSIADRVALRRKIPVL